MPTNNNTTFSTQATILKQLGVQNSQGLCSPLANLYANYKMGHGSRDFLDAGPEKTYERAKKMEAHQSEVARKVSATNGRNMGGFMGLHVSFWDNNKLLKSERVPVEKLETIEGAKSVLESPNHELSEHALIDYPTSTESAEEKPGQKIAPYHQVYFGHTPGSSKCSYFNANRQGGEFESDCDRVLTTFVEDIKKSAAHDGRDCIIGRSLA